jgi:hypothetical protein
MCMNETPYTTKENSMPDVFPIHDSPYAVHLNPHEDEPIISQVPSIMIQLEGYSIVSLTHGQAIGLINALTSAMEVAIYG